MANKKEEKRTDIITNLREGNISLILDSYDDLFSDFDPRPYSERALSDDFLIECKKAARDKEGKFELRFFVPKSKRNISDEVKIKKRLREHFMRHYFDLERQIRKTRFTGVGWFILGAILMLISTFLVGMDQKNFFFKFLLILLEPAGWFLFWEGLNYVFMEYKEMVPDFNFYKKMSHLEIFFLDY